MAEYLERWARTARKWTGLAAIAAASLCAGLSGCGRESAAGISSSNDTNPQNKTEEKLTNKICLEEDFFGEPSNVPYDRTAYSLEISYSWDTGISLSLHGEPIDFNNSEKAAAQIKRIEEEFGEYEKLKKELIKSNGTNIYFPKICISEKLETGSNRWSAIGVRRESTFLERLVKKGFFTHQLNLLHYENGDFQTIQALNESEITPVFVFWCNKKDNPGYRISNPVIESLHTNLFGNFPFYKIIKSRQLESILEVSPSRNKLLILEKGVRTVIFTDGELEVEKGNLKKEEIYKEIEKRIKKYLDN